MLSTTPTTSDTTHLRQEKRKRMLMSPHFQENVKWWQGNIIHENYIRRFELTPFQLFPYTTPEKGRSITTQMEKVSIRRGRSDMIVWELETTGETWKT